MHTAGAQAYAVALQPGISLLVLADMVHTINNGWRPNVQESDTLQLRLWVLFAPYNERVCCPLLLTRTDSHGVPSRCP
jgi:hypothetical protein